MKTDDLYNIIRDVPDFPKPGILFKDITPLLKSPQHFSYCLDVLQQILSDYKFDYIAGIESRGFVFAAPLADRLNTGFVPIRKPGKLPWKSYQESYDLEYGSNTLEIHRDALEKGSRVVVMDDLLATGGTALAANKLVEKCDGTVVLDLFVIGLSFLNGTKVLEDYPTKTILNF
ncbi:MAG: adenine phosphoribosyltransferase [Calditrichaeota bacterium]|nr:MAG: adenine phosphoribosyltransferase [Calditrichota bacterium]